MFSRKGSIGMEPTSNCITELFPISAPIVWHTPFPSWIENFPSWISLENFHYGFGILNIIWVRKLLNCFGQFSIWLEFSYLYISYSHVYQHAYGSNILTLIWVNVTAIIAVMMNYSSFNWMITELLIWTLQNEHLWFIYSFSFRFTIYCFVGAAVKGSSLLRFVNKFFFLNFRFRFY